jgi:hypothetical protein
MSCMGYCGGKETDLLQTAIAICVLEHLREWIDLDSAFCA